MSRETVLNRARAFAEGGFKDTCTITRKTGVSTNDLTGVETPTYAVIYTGRCEVKQPSTAGDRAESGEASVVVLRPMLKLPVVGSEAVASGDRVVIDTALNDSALTGQVFNLRDTHQGTWTSARRLVCEEPT